MSDFFEDKKNSQLRFRSGIDKFLKQSSLIATENQLDMPTVTSILSGLKCDIVQNNRINMEKLFDLLKEQESGYMLNHSDFQSIFGTQKSMKIADLCQVLKNLNLNSFDLKQQIKQMCFEGKKWKNCKMVKQMKQIGISEPNQKNKEIIIDCFDFNGDGDIDEADLDYLVEMIRQFRSKDSDQDK